MSKYRREFSRLIWQLASPQWNFDDATFERSAAAFDNPDHVAIVIHNYRWRQGLADGEARYDDLEAKLAQGPVIAVPTITMEGDANGAPHPEPAAYAKKFSGKYEHRTIIRRHRAQSASGSAARIRRSDHRYRWRSLMLSYEPVTSAAVRADNEENMTMRKTIVLLALATIVLLMLIQFSPSFLAS